MITVITSKPLLVYLEENGVREDNSWSNIGELTDLRHYSIRNKISQTLMDCQAREGNTSPLPTSVNRVGRTSLTSDNSSGRNAKTSSRHTYATDVRS